MKHILTDWLGGEKLAERVLAKLELQEANRILKEICDEEGLLKFPELERDLTVGDVSVEKGEIKEVREKRYRKDNLPSWG